MRICNSLVHYFSIKWIIRFGFFPVLMGGWIIFQERVLFYTPQLQKKITNSLVYYVDVLSDLGDKACLIFYDSSQESFQVTQVDTQGTVHWKKDLHHWVEENGRHSPYFCISRKDKDVLYRASSAETVPSKEWTKSRFEKSGDKEYIFFHVEGETFVPTKGGVFFVDKSSPASSAVNFFSLEQEKVEKVTWLLQKYGFFYNPYYWKEADMLVYSGLESVEIDNKIALNLYLHRPNWGSLQKKIDIFNSDSEDPLDVMKFSGNNTGKLLAYGSEGKSLFVFHKNRQTAQEILFPELENLVSFDFCMEEDKNIWVVGTPLGYYIPQLHLYKLKKMILLYHKIVFWGVSICIYVVVFLFTKFFC